MDQDGKIETQIVQYLGFAKRGSVDRILTAVRRNKLVHTTKQQVAQRCSYLEAQGVLIKHRASTRRIPIWRLSDSKTAELAANHEMSRVKRAKARQR